MIVNDEAKILLVDAESECVGRDYRLDLVVHERVLNCFSVGSRPLAVIEADVVSLRQFFVEALRFFHRRDINHARAFVLAKDLLDN